MSAEKRKDSVSETLLKVSPDVILLCKNCSAPSWDDVVNPNDKGKAFQMHYTNIHSYLRSSITAKVSIIVSLCPRGKNNFNFNLKLFRKLFFIILGTRRLDAIAIIIR
jgi:hypothetical protein